MGRRERRVACEIPVALQFVDALVCFPQHFLQTHSLRKGLSRFEEPIHTSNTSEERENTEDSAEDVV